MAAAKADLALSLYVTLFHPVLDCVFFWQLQFQNVVGRSVWTSTSGKIGNWCHLPDRSFLRRRFTQAPAELLFVPLSKAPSVFPVLPVTFAAAGHAEVFGCLQAMPGPGKLCGHVFSGILLLLGFSIESVLRFFFCSSVTQTNLPLTSFVPGPGVLCVSPYCWDPAASVFITSLLTSSGPGIQLFSSCRGRKYSWNKLTLFLLKSIVIVLSSFISKIPRVLKPKSQRKTLILSLYVVW